MGNGARLELDEKRFEFAANAHIRLREAMASMLRAIAFSSAGARRR